MFVNTYCQWAMGHSDKSVFGRLQKQGRDYTCSLMIVEVMLEDQQEPGKGISLTSQYGTRSCTPKLRDRCSTE